MSQPSKTSLSPAAEEALFQRLLRRLEEAGQSVASGAEAAVEAVAEAAEIAASGARTAAEAVGIAASQTANLMAEAAKDAGGFVQKHGLDALSALGLSDSDISGPLTTAAAQKIVENRRNKEEPVAQVLFRVPEHLRDDVKRLALDEKRQMDELLTEAVLDLLLKHGRMPKVFQKSQGSDTDRTG